MPLAAAVETGAQLVRLKSGDLSHLGNAEVQRLEEPEQQTFGMRGRLSVYPVALGVDSPRTETYNER